MRFTSILALPVLAAGAFDDSGVLGWFTDQLDEVSGHKLEFEGELPSYVRGLFVQSGPGRFTVGDSKLGHAFDGFGKMNRLHFAPDGAVTFSSRFLQTKWLNASLKAGHVTPAVLCGQTDPPMPWGPVNALFGHSDNNDIKAHRIGTADFIFGDTPIASVCNSPFESLNHTIRPLTFMAGVPGVRWHDEGHVSPATHICPTAVMAHGKTDGSGVFTGALSCIAVTGPAQHDYHIVFNIDPASPGTRKLLAKIKLPRSRPASYMHAMAHTKNHVTLIAQPLHMSLVGSLEGKPLSEGGLYVGKDTVFQVVSRRDGSVREFRAPAFLFAHIANSWEDGDDIVIDLTWYDADPDRMMYFKQFLLRNLEDKAIRDAWPIGKLVRYRLKADGTVTSEDLLPEDTQAGTQFELIKIDERRHGKEYCTFYGFQVHSNAYDEAQNSTKVGPTFAVGAAKRNLCTGERRGFYAANEFPSEPEFVPNPAGTDEDDGVLVSFVLNGTSNSSFVQVLDAKTMKRVATARLPIRLPFLIHSSFFPEGSGEYQTRLV